MDFVTAHKLKVKQNNKSRIIFFRTPSPTTVGGNISDPAAVNNQGESQPVEVERNGGFGMLAQQPSPTLRSIPVPSQAPESSQAWMELDEAPTTPAMCDPMIDHVGATEIELAFSFDDVDVVDIESVLGAEIGTWVCRRTVTAMGLLMTIPRSIYYAESTYAQLPATTRNDSFRSQLPCNEALAAQLLPDSIADQRMRRSQLQPVRHLLWP